VLLFYNERTSFSTLVELMRSERDRLDAASALTYHINLVQLLACCTEGKNVYTEIKCHSLLPLDDIVKVVTHEDCVPEVRVQYRFIFIKDTLFHIHLFFTTYLLFDIYFTVLISLGNLICILCLIC